ncbi:hypothetical protein HDZ31DRAFT_36200 [Schizophyllum fasciatum]
MNGASSSRGAGARIKPLKRGKACMNCRFLKIKCDGARPVCGPCLKHPKDDECEYDGPGRSRTKALEEQVHRLETRIQELENPGETTPSVTLHEPYSPSHQVSLSPHSSPTSHAGISLSASISPYETTPVSTGSPSLLDRPHALPIKSSSSGGSRASPAAPDRKPFSPFEEPDVSVIRVLLDNFLPHASEFGFFLSTSRFHQSALIPASPGHASRPLPALLFAVYLFGVHLSTRTDAMQAQSTTFLNQTLQTLSVALTSGHPQRVLHTIQTHVLLAYFFYRSGLNIEAKYHAAAACSLVISSGLHKVRSPNVYAGILGESPVRTSPILLHKPVADAVEEGERISALWATFALSRLLAVALDPPEAICGVFDVPGVQIDTPWPLTMQEYEDGALPDGLQSTGTVRNFVNNNDWYSGNGNSVVASFAKAVILIHRAAYVAGLFSDPMSPRDYQTFSHLFTSTHALLVAFRDRIPALITHTPPVLAHGSAALMPPPASPVPQDPSLRTLLLTHSLTNAALIKLHLPFFGSDAVSRQHCVVAAQAMFDFGNVDVTQFACLNPIAGTLWTLGIQVLVDEVGRLRSTWASAHGMAGAVVPYDATEQGVLMHAEEEACLARLRVGMHALVAFADDSALTSTCSLLASAHLRDAAADVLPPEMQMGKCQELFTAL